MSIDKQKIQEALDILNSAPVKADKFEIVNEELAEKIKALPKDSNNV